MSTANKIQVDIVSDVMCPWCFIGKRRFEKALKMLTDFNVIARWRPFLLDPTIPEQGKDRKVYLIEKFGSLEAASKLYAQIEAVGLQEGIKFSFETIEKSPSTMNCHRLIKWSQASGQQNQLVELLFKSYFIDGVDLSQSDALVNIAGIVGMDKKLVAELLKTTKDVELTKSDIDHARQIGITGVPVFIVNGKHAIVGAESPEKIFNVIKLAAENCDSVSECA